MQIKSFCFNFIQENTYIVTDETKQCAIIDPGCVYKSEESQLANYIDENGLKPVLLLNTHLHFDHILGNAFVAQEYGLTAKAHVDDKIFLDNSGFLSPDFPKIPVNYDFPMEWINEGDRLAFGNSTIQVLHTPGHSPGSLSFYCPEANAVFSGDTLFLNSVGRTDFVGGDSERLADSIYTKLFPLPDNTEIYPGHGPKSSVIEEKTHNPYV